MGVTVTFIAILELMKEGLIEIVQAEPYAPIHVRPASGSRRLSLVSSGEAVSPDAENEAALAQPSLPDEDAEVDVDAEVPADSAHINVDDSDSALPVSGASDAAIKELTPADDSVAAAIPPDHNDADDSAVENATDNVTADDEATTDSDPDAADADFDR